MNSRSSLPSNKGGSSDKALLCLAFFAILAIVVVSVIGFSNCTTDNGDGTENEQVYFTTDSIRYVVLKDTDAERTVGVARNDYGSEVVIPEYATDEQTGKVYTVVSIERNAFNGYDQLKKVVIPSTVTNIDPTAFRGCTLFEIELIDNTSFIFQNGMLIKTDASGWTVVKYNGSGIPTRVALDVTAVGDYAFEGTDVTSVVFQSVNKIGYYSFANCKQLQGVSSDTAITEYGEFAFSGCTSLRACDLDDVASIPCYLFENCTSLTEVKLPSNLEWIGAGAFDGCTGLASISIPETVDRLNDKVFRNCSSLTTIHLHKNLTSVETSTFLGCTGMKSFTVDSENQVFFAKNDVLYKKVESGNCLYIFPGDKKIKGDAPVWTFGDVNTNSIAPYAFSSCVKNEYGVNFKNYKGDTINDYAFTGSHITHTIDGVKILKVGNHAFENCIYLEILSFSNTDGADPHLTTIGEYAFAGCIKLYQMDKQYTVKMPKSLTSLGENAFAGCSSIKEFGSESTSFSVDKKGALYTAGMKKLIQYPLGSSATTFTVPKATTEIASEAFVGAMKLTDFYIEESNGSFVLDKGILYDADRTTLIQCPCGKTGTVKVLDGVKNIRDHAFENSKVGSVDFNDVQKIGDYAFRNCSNLTISALGADVTSIGKYAFSNIKGFENDTLTLPSKVTTIGDYAFAYNANLKKVIIEQTAHLSFDSTKFKGCGELDVFVPYSSFLMYKTYCAEFYYANDFYTIVTMPKALYLTYNGQPQRATVTDNFTLTGDVETDAGTYTAKITPRSDKGYVWDINLGSGTKDYKWTIEPREIQLTDVTGKDKVYDGTTSVSSPKIVASNIVSGDTVTFTADFEFTSKDAGARNVVAKNINMSQEKSNYKLSTSTFTGTTAYTISKKVVNVDAKSVNYCDQSYFVYENIPTGVGTEKMTLYYFLDDSSAGIYVKGTNLNVYYTTVDGKSNYEFGTVGNFTVKKIDYDMSKVKFEPDSAFYDGNTHSIYVSGSLPTGIDGSHVTVSYSGNDYIDAGTYVIVATFATDSKNYNVPEEKRAVLVIGKCELAVGPHISQFNGTNTFEWSEFRTGVGNERITLIYTTDNIVPGTYVWKAPNNGFTLDYSSPDGKKNYTFWKVGDFEITAYDVIVKLDPNHDGLAPKEVKLTYNEKEPSLSYKLSRDDVKDIVWDGHLQAGWYYDDGTLLDFDYYIIEDETFKAGWATVSGSEANIVCDKNAAEIDLTGASINKVNITFSGINASLAIDVTGKTGHLVASLEPSESNVAGRYVLNINWDDGTAYTGNVTLGLQYDGSQGNPVPYYYPASGDKVKLDGKTENGKVMFTASNFSNAEYGVEYVPATNADNTGLIIAAVIIVLAILAGAGYYYVKKRNA